MRGGIEVGIIQMLGSGSEVFLSPRSGAYARARRSVLCVRTLLCFETLWGLRKNSERERIKIGAKNGMKIKTQSFSTLLFGYALYTFTGYNAWNLDFEIFWSFLQYQKILIWGYFTSFHAKLCIKNICKFRVNFAKTTSNVILEIFL